MLCSDNDAVHLNADDKVVDSVNTPSNIDAVLSTPCVQDLPGEIISQIAEYVWEKEQYADWHEPVERFAYRRHAGHLQRRRNVLAFSLCSKSLRQVVFYDLMLSEVFVELHEKELSDLASLCEDTRYSVSMHYNGSGPGPLLM
jgi:hypothetical protein